MLEGGRRGGSSEVRASAASTAVPRYRVPGIAPLTWLRGLRSGSFHDFMLNVRQSHGDVVRINLWPVLPPIYLLMGKSANRGVLRDLDASLEQVLQDLINFLPVSANIPSEVDVELQKKVATLFQSSATVNSRLPSFIRIAERIRAKWLDESAQGEPLNVFFELSEFVLRADLEILYGPSFAEKYADRILPDFQTWVGELGQLGATPVGFFTRLGEYLTEALRDRRANPEAFAEERSVMQIYLQEGALDSHDEAGVVGLLTMTLMAAVFNTQVSLAWILAHLYSEPELLATARRELRGCQDPTQYSALSELTFINSCIDESVRLHTMLPGNTVLRRATEDLAFEGAQIPKGSLLWLYPNAVHRDEAYFPQATSFCPYRLLREGWGAEGAEPTPFAAAAPSAAAAAAPRAASACPMGGATGPLQRMSDEYELVTFGHGTKRCIGEKMARAMICAFLGTVLPRVDADIPRSGLPEDDNLFDLIPASKLVLHNVRPHRASPEEATVAETSPRNKRAA